MAQFRLPLLALVLASLRISAADATCASYCGPLGLGMEEADHPCALPWMQNATVCPYGYAGKGGVTIPNYMPPFQTWMLVFWGYSEYIVMFGALIECFIHRGTREISFLLFVGVIVNLNERVFKGIVVEARPDKSCQFSCGMPSGHSSLAMAFLTVVLMDLASRVSPLSSGRHSNSWIKLISVVPLSRSNVVSNNQFMVLAGFWSFLLLPVPMSRVLLSDHTAEQATVGASIGTIEGILFHLLYRVIALYLFPYEWSFPKKSKCHLIKHTMLMPWWYYNNHVCTEDTELEVNGSATEGVKHPVKGAGWQGVVWRDGDDLSSSDDNEDS